MNLKIPRLDMNKIRELAGRAFSRKAGGAVLSQEPERLIGCDYGQGKIVLAQILKSPGKVVLERFDILAADDKQSRSSLLAAKMNADYPLKKVRTSVKGQSVIVRFIQFPRMKYEEMKSAIRFEAENYIPFKSDEVILDFYILDGEGGEPQGGMMDVLLVAVKKDIIYPLIKDFQDAGLQIELIDVDVLASINAFEFCYPEDFRQSVGLLDLGKEISTISILRDGRPRFIRDISYGGVDIAKRLRRKLGMSGEDAVAFLTGAAPASPQAEEVLKEGYETLCADLKVSMDYYLGQGDAQPLEKLFLAGGGDSRLLIDVLSAQLKIPVLDMTLNKRVELGPGLDAAAFEKNQKLLAVAMGLCLRS